MAPIENRLPSLDGLRALSIVLVIIQHFDSSHKFGPATYLWRFQLGDMGVRIFFVLSGFLITSLLLREYANYKTIDLRKFYMRRFLRIFPAYYAYLGILAFLAYSGATSMRLESLYGPILYLSNYMATERVLAHTWSLAVEQQFYLLWPLIILMAGVKRATGVAIFFLVFSPMARVFVSISSDFPPTLWTHFETAGDPLAVGCIFAVFRERMARSTSYQRLISGSALLTAIMGLFFLSMAHRWPMFWNLIGISVANLLIVFVVDVCMRIEKSVVFVALNSRIAVYFGGLSYSIYIWQQFFAYGKISDAFYPSLLMTLAAAALSHHLIELPSLKFKSRFSRSSGPKRTCFEAERGGRSSAVGSTPGADS